MTLQERLTQYLGTARISQSRCASQIGVSPAKLSQWLAGKYPGDVADVDIRVHEYLSRETERATSHRWVSQFVETTNSRNIDALCRLAHLDGEICVCTGEAGTGKTEAVRRYAAQNKGAVILVEVDPTYSRQTMLRKLHQEVGLSGTGAIDRMFDDCVAKLKDTGRLLIVDEAEYLPTLALDILRRLHDHTGIGIALIGLPKLIEVMRGMYRDNAQIYSRAGHYLKLTTLTVDDTAHIAAAYLPVNGNAKHLHAATRGNARTLTKLVRRLRRTVDANPDLKIDKDAIDQVAETLII